MKDSALQAEELNPGRELDKLIAEKVMGRSIFSIGGEEPYRLQEGDEEKGTRNLAYYSTDIAAAWEVVEKMEGIWDIHSTSGGWRVYLAVRKDGSAKHTIAGEKTIEHTICIAALKAVED